MDKNGKKLGNIKRIKTKTQRQILKYDDYTIEITKINRIEFVQKIIPNEEQKDEGKLSVANKSTTSGKAGGLYWEPLKAVIKA